MDRRQFLKSTIPVAAWTHSGWTELLFGSAIDEQSSRTFGAYDLVVLGGTLSGCFAALEGAQLGRRVLLIERRTFLATEITATLRPWLDRGGWEAFDGQMRELFLPEAEKPEIGVPFDADATDSAFGSELPLFCGSVKKQFMGALLNAGAHVLLMTGAWGILADREKKEASGVALANKFGHQVVFCKQIIDAAGGTAAGPDRGWADYSFCLEFYGVNADVENELSVPDSLGLLRNKIYVHRGKRMPGQRFVEFHFPASGDTAESEARQKTEMLCAHLIRRCAPFAKARLAQVAWETVQLSGARDVAEEPGCCNYRSLPRDNRAELSCRAVLTMKEQAEASVGGLSFAKHGGPETQFIHHRSGPIPLRDCEVTPVNDIRANEAIKAITFPYEKYLPGTVETDLVIAGGGTAGAPAAMAALERGANVVTVEYFPDLGGTKTLGGVMGYYWGYRKSDVFRQINEGVRELSARLGSGSSRAAMMFYFRKAVTQNNGRLLTNTIISGATKQGNRVTGLVVERNGELAIVRGRVVIDATGDADVAVFAGAAWEFGNQRMQATQNYSQWDVNPGLRTWQDSSTNRDYDILANHTMGELQRGYELTHHESHYYDFMPMLTVRESRRVVGEYTITLKDVIEERRHADTISLAHSDYDPHHFGDTALTRVGCLLPHGISAVVEIPYRALIPKGLDGLLVSAKAISQTHNALQFTRMSIDIMTLGYVTGCIGASLCRRKIAPRDFDVTSLGQTLSDLNIIAPDRSDRAADAAEETERVARRIEALESGEDNSLIRILALPREKVEPLLVRCFVQAGSDAARLRIAKALAWFGNRTGNSLIVDEMKRLFEEEEATGKLPWEYYRKDQSTHYWTINQDIALLGLSGERSMLPAILDLADALKIGNPPVRQETAYNRGRIDLRLVPYYNRMINLCFVIERMPEARAIGTLGRFLDDPYIKNGVTRVPHTADEKVYAGILESRIAAALARCGARRGFDILIGYLNDLHPFLASYARQELKSVLQEDHACDDRRWKACLDNLTFPRAVASPPSNVIEW